MCCGTLVMAALALLPGAGIASTLVGSGSLLATFNSEFNTYDLKNSIGSIVGSSFVRPDLTFNTNQGGLNLSSGGSSTFTAVVLPEPASLTLLCLGIAAIV